MPYELCIVVFTLVVIYEVCIVLSLELRVINTAIRLLDCAEQIVDIGNW